MKSIIFIGTVIGLIIGIFLISGCLEETEAPPPPIVGGDKDEFGCLGSAGYQWCPSKQICMRMWEEYCDEYKEQFRGNETDIPGDDEDKHGCIGSAGYSWCTAKQKCLRSWEEPCVEENETDVPGDDEDEHGCIGTAGFQWCPSKDKCMRMWEEYCEDFAHLFKGDSSVCGIEQCHGLDITCGSSVPEACTMEYRLGDYCRKFVECRIVDNNCENIENNNFEKCVDCVEICDSLSDPIDAFDCENDCVTSYP